MTSRLHGLVVLACVVGLVSSASAADGRAGRVPLSQRGVDRLSVKNGPALLGAVLHRDADGRVTMAVRRDWLKVHDKGRLAGIDASTVTTLKESSRQLLGRLDDWEQDLGQGDRSEQAVLPGIRRERTRVERVLRDLDQGRAPRRARFEIVVTPARDVVQLLMQPVVRKRVALVAWVEELDDVESRSVEDLQAELNRKGIVPEISGAESLWRELSVVRDDDSAWRVRRAIKSCESTEPWHLQGTGNLLLAASGDGQDILKQEVDAGTVEQLVGELLGGGDLGGLLKELGLGTQRTADSPGGKPSARPVDPLHAAVVRAERAGKTSLRVTRFRHDLVGKKTTVKSSFVVRLSADEWVVAWELAETVAVTDRPEATEAKQRIKRDPRVSGLLKLARVLGGGDQAIGTALGFGAATQVALRRVDAKFLAFRDRHLPRLDTPPVWPGRVIKP